MKILGEFGEKSVSGKEIYIVPIMRHRPWFYCKFFTPKLADFATTMGQHLQVHDWVPHIIACTFVSVWISGYVDEYMYQIYGSNV